MSCKKLLSFILCFLILISTLVGCDTQSTDYILYIETDQAPSTIDPQLANGTSEEMIVRNLFEGLMRIDGEGNIKNGVAKSVNISDDRLIYTFKIRDDAFWSDGSKVAADDFVFAAQRALDPATKAPKVHFLYSIKNAKEINNGKDLPLGITATSERELKIELSAQNPDFLRLLTTAVFMPCNRKAFERFKGKYGMNDENFISNGSFCLKSWAREGEFSLRINKNKEYSGDFNAEASAVIFSVGDRNLRMDKLNKNNVDMGFVNYAESSETVTVEEFSKTCYALTINPSSQFAIDEFKKAIKLSLDMSKLKSKLDISLEYANNILPNVILKDTKSISTLVNTTPTVLYQPEKARENYLSGVKKHGNPDNITIIYSGDDSIKTVALFVAESLQKTLGVVANIENISDDLKLKNRMLRGEYVLAIAPITAQSSSLTQYLSVFSSENSSNIYRFSNKAFDNILSSTNDYMGEEELVSLTNSMLKIIDDSLLVTPLFLKKEAFGYAKIYTSPKISPFDGVIDFAFVRK